MKFSSTMSGRTALIAVVLVLGGGAQPDSTAAQPKEKAGKPKAAESGSRKGLDGRSPSSATTIGANKFQALRDSGRLAPVSDASVELGWELAGRLDSAWQERLAGELAKDPKLLSRLTASPRPDGKSLVSLPGGGYRARVVGADAKRRDVVLLGESFATRDTAEGLEAVQRRATWQRTYAALYGRISELVGDDSKAGRAIFGSLPPPYGAKGDKRAPDYAKLVGTLAGRWAKNRPADSKRGGTDCTKCAAAFGAFGKQEDKDASCRKPRAGGLLTQSTGMLVRSRTCVRDQGPTRGTQIGFAISAGVEGLIAARGETCVDLSEQHLHYAQKNEWFPIPPNFGEDENPVGDVLGMMLADYRFRYERAWPYNRSSDRSVTREAKGIGGKLAPLGYEGSCKGYPGKPCSDTNHQGEYVCEKGAKSRACGYTASVTEGASTIRVLGYAPLLDVRKPGRGIELARTFVDLGVPVVASFGVTRGFLDAGVDGYVRNAKSKDHASPLGWHTALLEGFVSNARLPKGVEKGAGGGYFIMKNSWGPCVGDAGYWYLPADWLAKAARSLTALTAIVARGKEIRRDVRPDSADEGKDEGDQEDAEDGGPVVLRATCMTAPTIWDPWPSPDEGTAVLYASDGIDHRINWEWHNYSCPSSYSMVCINLVTNGAAAQGDVCYWQETGPTFPLNSDNSKWTGSANLETGPYAYGPPYSALKGREIEIRAKSCVQGLNSGETDCEWSAPRRALVALSSPVLVFPGSVGEPGNRVTAIDTRKPLFYWTPDPDADSYRLVIQKTGPITPDEQEIYVTTEPGYVLEEPISDQLGNSVVWWVRSCKTISGELVCSKTNWEEFHQQYWYLELPSPGAEPDAQHAADMFSLIAGVFRHPRCTNCHAPGDQPLRFDPPDTAPHGGDCTSCHFDGNTVGAPFVPATALHPWQKAPASMALTAAMSAHDICEQIKEHKTPAENVNHVAIDELIIYAWDPGGTREPAPGTHAAFVSILNEWAENGGACPP